MEKDEKKQEENVEKEHVATTSDEEGGDGVNPNVQSPYPSEEQVSDDSEQDTKEEEAHSQLAASESNAEDQKEKTSSSPFDFQASLQEMKGVALDAVLRPNTLVHSGKTIRLETSLIIFALLAVLVSVSHYLFYRYGFGGLLSYFGGVDFTFFLQTFLSWLITFAIGYFSLYFLLKQFGNKTMEHKELLTKYAVVNIPFVLVFCLVTLFIGLVLVDLFIVTYVFSLLLFGFIHVYLFLALMEKSRYDVFWTLTVYQLVLILASYFLVGVDFGGL